MKTIKFTIGRTRYSMEIPAHADPAAEIKASGFENFKIITK